MGHGFTAENRTKGTAYYTVDKGPVRMIVMDTVNPNGYADGSLDGPQFTWLKQVIDGSADKLVVLFSHHTSAHDVESLGGDRRRPEPACSGLRSGVSTS